MIGFFAKQLLSYLSSQPRCTRHGQSECNCKVELGDVSALLNSLFWGSGGETWGEAAAERELLGCLPLRD